MHHPTDRISDGHTHLMHSYILKKDPPPKCEHCQCILTFRHILVECNNFSEKMGEMLWNHLDSTPHSLYFSLKVLNVNTICLHPIADFICVLGCR